jgi:hypothetical protein
VRSRRISEGPVLERAASPARRRPNRATYSPPACQDQSRILRYVRASREASSNTRSADARHVGVLHWSRFLGAKEKNEPRSPKTPGLGGFRDIDGRAAALRAGEAGAVVRAAALAGAPALAAGAALGRRRAAPTRRLVALALVLLVLVHGARSWFDARSVRALTRADARGLPALHRLRASLREARRNADQLDARDRGH